MCVIDNFYSGHHWAVPDGAILVEGNAGDIELTSKLMREHDVDTVIHFAGHIVVPESVTDPLKYYRNNTQNSRNLLQASLNCGVNQFVSHPLRPSTASLKYNRLQSRQTRHPSTPMADQN